MKRITFSLFVFLLLAAAPRLHAQASFTAKVSQKVIGQEDLLQVDFVLDGVSEVDQFSPPSFGSFQVAQGPSYTSGFNLINGNTSRYYSVTFLLKPTSLGKFTFGPASVLMGNQTMHSNSVSVEVVKGSTGGGVSPQQSNPFQGMMPSMNMDPLAPSGREMYGDQFLRKGEKAEDKIRKNMILRMTASKNSVYVGEPVVATCKLYSRLQSDSKVAERPSFSGFSVFEMVQPEQGTISREMLNGRPYNGYLIRKAQLYPLQSGSLTIEPVELDNNVTFYRQAKPTKQQAPSGSVFDQMMQDFWGDEEGEGVPEKHALNLITDSITIHVKPLPDAGKPADFSGAVGQFTIQASLTSTTVKANQTDTLQLVLAGSGNLPLINAPALHLPSGLEVYDPSAKEQIDQTIAPIKGRKVFSYAFTANSDGQFTLPSIRFSYFNPQTAAYITDSTPPMLLQVLPGPGGHRDTSGQTTTQGVAQPLLRWIWLGAGLLLVLAALVGLSRARRKRPTGAAAPKPGTSQPEVNVGSASADNAPVRRSETAPVGSTPVRETEPAQSVRVTPQADPAHQPYMAPSITTYEAKDWMESARRQLRENDSAAYYRELNAGLWALLREYLDLGQERDKNQVLQRLERKGFSPYVREEVRKLLEECELALYAPIHTGSDMQRNLDVAERLQKRFEHNLKD
ncbi:BatD family protein [Dinghuibacter silviterrae]|uniref:Oxygen tolerance protein BatD n=1 Tax=Dinghuibacter silviterrae TaxID=1539049 RepID=A0A4R8DPH2_9BACT|nr:BatD family protein [Dinghuibacter silviterrae]TDW99983.1 oxygen tolerance protein BatD [Dinghuibacter silviterrae]